MIVAIFTVLAVWLWLWLVFLGFGTIVCRIARCDRQDSTSLLVSPWIGVAAVIAFLQIWHLAAPVNPIAFAAVSTIGLFGTATFCRRQLAEMFSQDKAHRGVTAITV